MIPQLSIENVDWDGSRSAPLGFPYAARDAERRLEPAARRWESLPSLPKQLGEEDMRALEAGGQMCASHRNAQSIVEGRGGRGLGGDLLSFKMG